RARAVKPPVPLRPGRPRPPSTAAAARAGSLRIPPVLLRPDQLLHLTLFGEPAQVLLREHQPAVGHHLEHPARRGDELDGGVRKLCPKLLRQTGGPLVIASRRAVLDGHPFDPHDGPSLNESSSGYCPSGDGTVSSTALPSFRDRM